MTPTSLAALALAAIAQPAGAPVGVATQAAPPKTESAAAPADAQKKSAEQQCDRAAHTADERQIVICAQRPNGYRLNPDIMEAKRELKKGAPAPPLGRYSRPDCATVGPIPCTYPGINLVGAALTAVMMAQKAARGEDVGQMFVTDPHPDEYHLYLMAKARREQEEAEAKAKKLREKAQAQAKAQAAPPTAAEPPPGK